MDFNQFDPKDNPAHNQIMVLFVIGCNYGDYDIIKEFFEDGELDHLLDGVTHELNVLGISSYADLGKFITYLEKNYPMSTLKLTYNIT